MTDPFLSALQDNQPADEVNGMVVGMSPQQRLRAAMRLARDDDTNNIPAPTDYSQFRVGLPNPYGRGLRAFEPNTVLFDAYGEAKNASDQSKLEDAAKADGQIKVGGATLGPADGQLTKAIAAAMGLAQRAVPYVWGGTSANGVDCSGLLYYAFNAAGIKVPRYRAVDWGKIGQAVTVDQARPGDVIYYDEPGDTDHVGLYIGGGLMIQAPQSGDHVRVSAIGKPTSIRRVFDDNAFQAVAMPDGSIGSAYNGRLYQPWTVAPIIPQTYPHAGGIDRAPARGTFSVRPQ